MIEEERDIELLERYHDHALDERERTAVEQRLKEDESFRKLYDDFKILLAGIQEVSRQEIKRELEQIESRQPMARVVPLRTWAVGIAASVILVVVAYWLWPRPTEGEKLFAQYFEPYPNVIMPTVRGDLELDTTLMAKAYRAYDSGDYEKAIVIFEQVERKDEAVYLYLGNSYLATNSPQKALICFEKLISDYDTFDQQAEWYCVMALLRMNDDKRVRNSLEIFANEDGVYKARAEEILTKLTK